MKFTLNILFVLFSFVFLACSSETSNDSSLSISSNEDLEIENVNEEQKLLDEEKKKEEEIYDKYIGNALDHGDVPYESCYGKFKKCKGNDCSEIKVTAAEDSDVLVSVKEDGKVIQHAYIVAGKSYTFTLENGTYQTFFYYGKGWNPEKFMKKSDCGDLLGGFIEDEAFGKDEPVELKNNILEYELIPQTNGNFHPAESSAEDAL